MSKNTIDVVIDYAEESNTVLGLIPSRRQVDYNGGYVGFNTKLLSRYIKTKTRNVLLERDHGGPGQGQSSDDGIYSIKEDSLYCDIIHIDPWKECKTIDAGIECTLQLINACEEERYTGTYEISTEAAIFNIDPLHLERMLICCKDYNVSHAVIQSGTQLSQVRNIGVFDREKLDSYLDVINRFNVTHGKYVLSKEHNGDYLETNTIHEKFKTGLDSINIAPEFGVVETDVYLDAIRGSESIFNDMFELCYNSNTWRKWILPHTSFEDAGISRRKLIQICGHYMFETDDFNDRVKCKLPDLTTTIQTNIKTRIQEILGDE